MKNMKQLLGLGLVLSMQGVLAGPIHDAVARADVTQVQKMLEESPGLIQDAGKGGATPLHIAAQQGSKPMAEMLLKKGAVINAKSAQLGAPLHLAVAKGDEAMVTFLLGKGADIDAKGSKNRTPLHIATEKKNVPMATFLVGKGAKVNVAMQWGWTPLHLAASRDHVPLVTLYLKKGARIDLKDSEQRTPLNLAAEGGKWAAVKTLIEHGAGIGNAYYHARKKGIKQMVKWFVERGAPPDLVFAIEQNDVALANLMIAKGADVNEQSYLYSAAAKGNLAMVKLLVGKRADPNKKTRPPLGTRTLKKTETPLDAAKRNKHQAVVDYLKPLTGVRGKTRAVKGAVKGKLIELFKKE